MDDSARIDTRSRLAGEEGMTLVEVLVSIMLVGLIALSFAAFDAVGRTSADQRQVAQATQIAQADQERLRGMSADQLSTLNQRRNVTVDGVIYTVDSVGKYQNSSTNGDTCASSSSSADYAKVTSTVSWLAHKAGGPRPQVSATSLITPRIGGSLIVAAQDQGAAALPGVAVTATGTDADTNGVTRTGTTDSTGCVIFGSLPVGTYSVASSLAGYLDASGATPTMSSITTTPGTTTNISVRLAQPGKIHATFVGITGTTGNTTAVPPGLQSTAPAMSWVNPNMSVASVSDPATDANLFLDTPQTVFPYITSNATTFTNNYTVYAGRCSSDLPTSATYQSYATVSPGVTANVVVKVPVINVSVTYNSGAVKPAHLKLTDTCGDTWNEPVATPSTKPSTGWLQYPGEPYGTSYTVCADYKYNSFSYRKNTATVNNTSFTAANGNTVTVAIPSSTTGTYQGQC